MEEHQAEVQPPGDEPVEPRISARRQSRLRHGALEPGFLMALPFLLIIRTYQLVLGPLMGGHCRFHPTCSEYGLEAYRKHGPVRGTWLTLRRILRCHPLGGSGFDPVP